MNSGVPMAPGQRPSPVEGANHNYPLVRKLSQLVPLSEDDIATLAQLSANFRRVASHVDLLVEGSEPREAILVLEGVAGRYKYRENGARQITSYLVPGDLCDADAILLSEMDYSLGTLTSCFVARIPRELLADVLERHPAIARGLRLSKLVEEATSREWLLNVGSRTALERLAHLLCELLVRLRTVGFATAGGYELALTQQDLADTLGLSNVHVNRTLRTLREQSLIEWRGKQLTILDMPRLEAVSNFKSRYLKPNHRTLGMPD